jgi:7-cyano-7-deazaguanine synthase
MNGLNFKNMQKQTSKAVILLSGGQDSTTCLYWAKDKFEKIFAISFDYGQKHKIELEAAKKIADNLSIPFTVFNIEHLLKVNNETNLRITQGRNALFLTIAGAYCMQVGAADIITGTCQMDFNDYPDCRRKFIDAQQLTLSLSLDMDIKIHTPLMYLTKSETWKMAKDLNCLDIIINNTVTDYNGSMIKNEWGYGVNDNHATELRVKGFYEAKQNNWI